MWRLIKRVKKPKVPAYALHYVHLENAPQPSLDQLTNQLIYLFLHREKVRDLRASGCIVIKALSGQKVNAHDLGCNQTLEKSDENWVLVTLN
jgi:hypothetical protein